MANDEARLEAIVKRVDELKSEKSVTDKELRKNIDDLSKKVSRTKQNTKDLYDRVEKLLNRTHISLRVLIVRTERSKQLKQKLSHKVSVLIIMIGKSHRSRESKSP